MPPAQPYPRHSLRHRPYVLPVCSPDCSLSLRALCGQDVPLPVYRPSSTRPTQPSRERRRLAVFGRILEGLPGFLALEGDSWHRMRTGELTHAHPSWTAARRPITPWMLLRLTYSLSRGGSMSYNPLKFFLGILAVLMLPALAAANSGSATVTYWRVIYSSATVQTVSYISVSNTTGGDVQITLRLRDHNGVWLGQSGFVPTISAGNFVSCNSTQNSCTLAAGRTAYFYMSSNSASDFWGYGKLEWSSANADVDSVAIVASGVISYISGSDIGRQSIVIARDQPF